MAINKLTALKVANAKPGKYGDGGGLQLVVKNGGAKKWIFRFTLKEKAREMGLGSAHTVSLAEARIAAHDCRTQVRAKIDPISARIEAEEESKKEKEKQKTKPTFTTCAAMFIRDNRRGWTNAKHARQWVSTLKIYARPIIGMKPVDTIKTEDILKIISPIWTTKTETAKRVQGRIENVLDYAAALEYCEPMHPARWKGHLDKLLPKPAKVKKIRHHPAMPYNKLPAFMVELSSNESISALALQFLILTATRTKEVLQATHKEIDLKGRTWTIPAERMKAEKEHRVPLSNEAISILEAAPQIQNNPYIFAGMREGKPLSNMAMLQLMRGMEYGVNGTRGAYVPHGFRSSFRDWEGEVSSFPRDVAEMALAHTIENKTEAAYRRGDLFAKRSKMMQAWANFCGLQPTASVTPIRDAGAV